MGYVRLPDDENDERPDSPPIHPLKSPSDNVAEDSTDDASETVTDDQSAAHATHEPAPEAVSPGVEVPGSDKVADAFAAAESAEGMNTSAKSPPSIEVRGSAESTAGQPAQLRVFVEFRGTPPATEPSNAGSEAPAGEASPARSPASNDVSPSDPSPPAPALSRDMGYSEQAASSPGLPLALPVMLYDGDHLISKAIQIAMPLVRKELSEITDAKFDDLLHFLDTEDRRINGP